MRLLTDSTTKLARLIPLAVRDYDVPVEHNDYIQTVELYLNRVRELTSAWKVFPRNPLRSPFDSVALSMVSKAFSLSEACLVLVRAGFLDEAYGLSRSLVEASLILRYLTSDQGRMGEKAHTFLWFSKAYKDYWLYRCRNIGNEGYADEVERLAKEYQLAGNPEPALHGWADKKDFTTYRSQNSIHPLDNSWMTSSYRSMAYASDYFQTSQFVHCSMPALESFLPHKGVAFAALPSRGEHYARHSSICFILINYTHLLLRYAMYGLGIEDSSREDALVRDALQEVSK